jgi:spermidine synthase
MTKNKSIIFNDTNIMLVDNSFVMMDWETELMSRHAKIITKNRGNILEIGFGMGISAQAIQDYGCDRHIIVESHPQILEKLKEWAIDKTNVEIIEGDWFEVWLKISNNMYDGIFYDADCYNMMSFRTLIVDRYLKENGIFTYFDPKGNDRYGYGDSLILDSVKITTEIPKNQYHNDQHCFCPYIINNKLKK